MENRTDNNPSPPESPNSQFVVEPIYKSSLHFWPPLVLLFVLALFLIWILLPGVLIYPEKNNEISVWENNTVTDQVTKNLKTRILDLKAEISLGECVPEDKSLLMPNPKNLLPSQVGNDVPESSNTLVNFIKDATVFVWNAPSNDAPSFGSGFFVTPKYIVTNQHVVENRRIGEKMQIFFSGGGEPIEVVLKAKSELILNSEKDFALLESTKLNKRYYPIFLPSLSLQLENVIAAGFPGDAFEAVGASGEQGELPVFITSGIINAEQEFANGGGAFVHSAAISLGNSGGPLIDACGRVLGVNTMVYSTDIRTLNIALNSSSLTKFLKKNNIVYTAVDTDCTPKIVSNSDPEVPEPAVVE
jgi:S1-C subfamily serine protease